jgi:hypothetical protein
MKTSSFGRIAYHAVRSILVWIVLGIAILSGVWIVWKVWCWAMPRAAPFLPAWLTAPDLEWFIAGWIVANIVLIAVLWKKGADGSDTSAKGVE